MLKSSQMFVGTDSGLLHMAVAVGTPAVAIFGPSNHKKWWPKEAEDMLITENVPCSPCAQLSYSMPTCNGRYFCLQGLDTDKINTAIEIQLKKAHV